MVERSDVLNAYRLFMGREPESESAISAHCNAPSLEALRQAFLGSREFRDMIPEIRPQLNLEDELPPQDLPPIRVDDFAGPDQLDALLGRIRREWEALGASEPHWSVLTHEAFRQESLAQHTTQFFASGGFVAQILEAFAQRHRVDLRGFDTCLELGCGVGRITGHLAKMFPRVVGVDISRFHLDVCREELHRQGVGNVTLACITDIARLRELPDFSFFCSFIVLQHNPPPVIRHLLECVLEKLRPGGIAVFQVPTWRRSYAFDLAAYLGSRESPHMEMHILPQATVFRVIREAGCELLEIREDGWAEGRNPHGLSNTFFVRKAAA